MTDPRKTADDAAFEHELAETSRAYRATDNSAAPPSSMDDAIRAAARRAVQAAPHRVAKPWLLRFSKPLSVAAVLVLTASLLIVSLEERPELAPPMAEKVGKIALPSQHAKVPADARGAGADVAVPASRLAEEAPAAPPPATVPAKRMELAPLPDRARRADSAERQVPPAEVKIAPSAPVAAPAYAPPAPPPPQIAAAPMPAPAIAPPTVANSAEVARERRDNAAPVALAKKEAAAPAMPAPAALASRAAAGAVVAEMKQAAPLQRSPVTATVADSTATIAPQAVPAPPVKGAGVSADLAKPAESPEAWLKRIIELRQQMKSKEADEELARFRKSYPDFVISPELKAATGSR